MSKFSCQVQQENRFQRLTVTSVVLASAAHAPSLLLDGAAGFVLGDRLRMPDCWLQPGRATQFAVCSACSQLVFLVRWGRGYSAVSRALNERCILEGPPASSLQGVSSKAFWPGGAGSYMQQ